MFQQTLGKPVQLAGIGLHTGVSAEVILSPTAPNTGIAFRRIDVDRTIDIPATWRNVVDTTRSTTLGRGRSTIQTVEHLLAALWGLGIDNVHVDICGPEVPAADGSAAPWVMAIRKAGRRRQPARRKILKIDRLLTFSAGESRVSLFPYPGLRFFYLLSYDQSFVGAQPYFFESHNGTFEESIAPARTFGFRREVDSLRRSGLARGGSLKNAVVVGQQKYMNRLRFPNELVRHKVLDLMGDLALLGRRIQATVVAIKSGHQLHLELLRRLERELVKNGNRP